MTTEGHGDIELIVDDLQRFRHAFLTHGTQAVEEGATDQRAIRRSTAR